MVGAEMPSNSDLIKWVEQGRLHTKYVNCTSAAAAGTDSLAVWTVNDLLVPAGSVTTGGTGGIAIRVGQTVFITDNTAPATGLSNKAIVTAVNYGTGEFTVAYYEAGGQAVALGVACTVMIYGSEFTKGTNGMAESLEADSEIFETSPIILKDKYAVNGSDMAQIGWVEVTTENGATGYLWYLKSEHETRLRFDDYLETSMIEAVPAEAAGGALAAGYKGTEGIFYVINDRGNVWSGGVPSTLDNFDTIIGRLDKQGAIEENVLFVNRQMGFEIDDMLAAQNSYGAGGTSYGLFDNDEQMALNLGFTGFRRRASETEDRRYKTWITGSAGGAATSDKDAMEVHFLSERAVCTMGANNFFLFEE
jgi:hypothetical protein